MVCAVDHSYCVRNGRFAFLFMEKVTTFYFLFHEGLCLDCQNKMYVMQL